MPTQLTVFTNASTSSLRMSPFLYSIIRRFAGSNSTTLVSFRRQVYERDLAAQQEPDHRSCVNSLQCATRGPRGIPVQLETQLAYLLCNPSSLLLLLHSNQFRPVD